MATVKGISLKGIKKFRGHDGENYQGNIYMDGKKIGFYSEDSWGGPSHVELISREVRDEVIKRAKEYFKEYPDDFGLATDEELFLDTIMSISLDEKDYKAAVKKGYAMTFIASSKYVSGQPHLVPIQYSIPKHLTTPEELEKLRNELKEKGFNQFKEYKTLDDFIIN